MVARSGADGAAFGRLPDETVQRDQRDHQQGQDERHLDCGKRVVIAANMHCKGMKHGILPGVEMPDGRWGRATRSPACHLMRCGRPARKSGAASATRFGC